MKKQHTQSIHNDHMQTLPKDAFFLDAENQEALTKYLKTHGWLQTHEKIVETTKAGEGNMNYTLRVTTNVRSMIVKQSRPWVEKYAHIAAPVERALIEALFYQTITPNESIARAMPKLLGVDSTSYMLLLEDLGTAADCTDVYAGAQFSVGDIAALVAYLSQLHGIPFDKKILKTFENKKMRKFNHDQIFKIPLEANGVDLNAVTPGLQEKAEKIKKNAAFVRTVQKLGKTYLKNGSVLVHGDYFPGSWLRTANGIKIIDPEFSFCGFPEFDLSVFVAHLFLSKHPESAVEHATSLYTGPLDKALVMQLTGVEITRRLIGVAQLPLTYTLQEKSALLDTAVDMVMK